MSRIGKMPIIIPNGVNLILGEGKVLVSGPKGNLEVAIPAEFNVEQNSGQVKILTKAGADKLDSQYGLVRALLNNAITGVTKGWEKSLELVGVGYRAEGGGSQITLNVGYTHQVKVAAPANITFTINDNTKIKISGIDKKSVGELAAQIRRVKPPEPYKGKGIRYLGEHIKKKAGKAVKAAGTS